MSFYLSGNQSSYPGNSLWTVHILVLKRIYRMVNRRGLPEEIYSDNATNFKAADKELKALLLQLEEDKIKASTSNKGIVWHFTPPLAPHFDGVHESMI